MKETRAGRQRIANALFLALFGALAATGASAQQRAARGTITFITAEYVYTSLGRSAGITDSAAVAVVSRGDTTARLRVAALSSKSSACILLTSKRKPAVGDSVISYVLPAPEAPPPPTAVDSTRQGASSPVVRLEPKSSDPGFVSVQGRVAAQYRALLFSQTDFNQQQPGVAVQLRGRFTNSSFSFQLSGNFRTMIRKESSIATNTSKNQTRVYRASVDFDDGTNAVSLGRILPPFSPSIGTVDGAMYAHTFGTVTLGATAGFEPAYIQGIEPTDVRKFSVFAAYRSPERASTQGAVVYSRTYYRSTLARNVLSASFTALPGDRIFLNAQTEVDLRTFSGGTLSGPALLTSLFASANLRLLEELSLGLGVSSWRPTYYLLSIASSSPSFIDMKLRTSPMFSVTVTPTRTVSLMNSYSPRSSDAGFAKEYNNSTSLSWSDALGSGMSLRGSYFLNRTIATDVKGFTVSAQKSLARVADLSVHFQRNRLDLRSFNETRNTDAAGSDLLLTLFGRTSFWISAERNFGDQISFTSFFAELSYRL